MRDVKDGRQRSRSHSREPYSYAKTLWGNSLRLLLGSGGAQLLRVLLAPLIARLFSPAALGNAQAYSAIGKTAAIIATLRYEDSIQLPEDERGATRQMVIAMLCTLANSIISLGILISLRTPISRILNAPQLENLLVTIPIFILLRGVFLALRAWHIRMTHYRRVSSAAAAEGFVWDVGSAGLGLAGFNNSAAIIWAQIAGQGTAALFLTVPTLARSKNWRFSWQELMAGMRQYRKFPLFNIWSKLLDNAALYMPVLLFSAFFSPAVAGQFTLGFNLLQLPFAMIANTVGQVLYQQAPQAQRQKQLDSYILALTTTGLKLAIPPVLLFALIGKMIITTLFGENWALAGEFVQVLSPWMLLLLLSLMIERIPAVIKKNENILIFQAANALMRLAALAASAYYRDPLLAGVLLSAGGCLVYSANILWVFSLVKIPMRKVVASWAQAIIPTLPWAAALLLLRFGLPWLGLADALVLIAVGGVVCAGYYLTLVKKDAAIKEILASLRTRKEQP